MPVLPRDPVCGMPADPATALSATAGGETFWFCSEYCRRQFLRSAPGRFSALREARPARRIAYFSMEIELGEGIPTYAGGLGVLAGDMLRSCADLRVPVVAVTLASRKGHFKQLLDVEGRQTEAPMEWDPEQDTTLLPGLVHLEIGGRSVAVRAFEREIRGSSGYVVPVLLLDTNLPENAAADRKLTDVLYGGDERYRLSQEVVLGVGGVRALRLHGFDRIEKFHLNEGHAALAAIELLRDQGAGEPDVMAVRERCVFTTHTPVPSGHDRFDYGLVREVLGEPVPMELLKMLGGSEKLNLTLLALDLSHYVNGVARAHQEVSEHLFPGRDIGHITNGVHSASWTSPSFRALFDRHVPGWAEDPALLRKALAIPRDEIFHAHLEARRRLLELVRQRTGRALSERRLTVGFARRMTAYKRPDLIFHDLERLRSLGRGRVQLVFSGKAHPADGEGKAIIRRIFDCAYRLGEDVPVAYVPDYDVEIARAATAGADVWLNTPQPPFEASGTSGMKAAHNGVPSLSVLDGWWHEGWIEGVTGWAIENDGADSIYRKLEQVLECSADKEKWAGVMRHCIALNASFFNTHRMVQQYVANAYLA